MLLFQKTYLYNIFKTCLSTDKLRKKKKIFEKYIRITETLKDAMIKKEMDEKVNAYDKQLRSEYMKLMN